MIDKFTIEECKKCPEILDLKIKNLEHAINQSELMISESKMDCESLIFLRRKIANSFQDLETLYLIKEQRNAKKSSL